MFWELNIVLGEDKIRGKKKEKIDVEENNEAGILGFMVNL